MKTLAIRLKELRIETGFSQEGMGGQGFVSTPAYVKLENGQRSPSEKLIERLIRWLVEDQGMKAPAAAALQEELLTLKYLGDKSPFVRGLAIAHAKTLPNGAALLADHPAQKPVRGRPVGSGKGQGKKSTKTARR